MRQAPLLGQLRVTALGFLVTAGECTTGMVLASLTAPPADCRPGGRAGTEPADWAFAVMVATPQVTR
ncbi:hypothetical protein [Streptomyces griseus]|uniref:hypothetical protein n=1 Tax=Streptomyces griseus TaxID=1911 RepID=UPI00084018A0|nr:hypothetical protein [Streptomyces griseus]